MYFDHLTVYFYIYISYIYKFYICIGWTHRRGRQRSCSNYTKTTINIHSTESCRQSHPRLVKLQERLRLLDWEARQFEQRSAQCDSASIREVSIGPAHPTVERPSFGYVVFTVDSRGYGHMPAVESITFGKLEPEKRLWRY